MLRFRSLRAIALTFIVAISAATLATGSTVYFALVATIDRQVDKRLAGEAAELLADNPDELRLAGRITEESRRRDSADIGFLLRGGNGGQIAHNIALAHPLPEGFSTVGRDVNIPGLSRGRALVRTLGNRAVLTLVAESEPIDDHDAQRLLILIAGFGTILLLIVTGTLALSLEVRRNIEEVRAAAEAIVDGDLQARVPVVARGTAFGKQAVAFNRMLDRIGELMVSLGSISNDVAHDMRTPLARLHGHLARLAADPGAAPVRPAVEDAIAQSEDLLAMFAAILRITEIEGGERRAMFAPLDLAALARDVAESLGTMVEESGRSLRFDALAPAQVEGDARLLTQMLVNLIENAVHHTPAGTTIRLSLACNGDAVLAVTDDGPGIPGGERAKALRRFGRLDASRNRPGHGLGLPLVQAIARLHRGTIELDDARPGLAVLVRLPLAGWSGPRRGGS